jgi:hypothetical protein
MNSLTSVLKSPSVWTGKDGVTSVTGLLKNSPLQDKIQLGLIKSSYDTLVQTGQIVTPGTDKKAPTGQLYNAAGNAGKSLVSATAGLVSAPKELSNLPTAGLSNIAGNLTGAAGKLTGALSGGLSGAAGALSGGLSGAAGALSGGLSGALKNNITGNLPNVSSLANRGTAELGGLLANASKFGVGNAVAWAKGAAGTAGAAAGSVFGGAINRLSGAGLPKTQMDSLAKQGQFAVNFSDFKLPAAVAGIVPAAGFKGTIDRSTLNAATGKLIGSDKISLPNFSPQSIDTSALTGAASKAKGLLSGGLDAGGLLSKARGALGGLTAGSIGGLAGGALGSTAGKLTGALSTAYSGTDSNLLSRVGRSPDSLLAAVKSNIKIG